MYKIISKLCILCITKPLIELHSQALTNKQGKALRKGARGCALQKQARENTTCMKHAHMYERTNTACAPYKGVPFSWKFKVPCCLYASGIVFIKELVSSTCDYNCK